MVISICFFYASFIYNHGFTYNSPDLKHQVIAYVKKSEVYLKILAIDKPGVVFEVPTGASSLMKWSLKWAANDKILFNSSDIGSYYWINSFDTWKKVPANAAFSSDGYYVATAVWLGSNKVVGIEIARPRTNDDYDILSRTNTGIVVHDLTGCLKWEGDEVICLNVSGRKTCWKKNENSQLILLAE